MIRKLARNGNSLALNLTRDIRDHLGISTEIEVQLIEGAVILRAPKTKPLISIEEADRRTNEQFGNAYRRLAGGPESTKG